MSYIYEQEMIPDIIQALPDLFDVQENYAHAQEVTEGSRVIDIVFTTFIKDHNHIEDLKKYARALKMLSKSQLLILAIIRKHKKISLNKISSLTYTNAKIISEEFLTPLIKLGLTQVNSKAIFRFPKWPGWKAGNVITIEAKLRDWKSAFNQAIDNKKRADYSYVAFPSGKLISLKHILFEAKSNGIGIIETNQRRGSRIIIKAKKIHLEANFDKHLFKLQVDCGILNKDCKWTIDTNLKSN